MKFEWDNAKAESNYAKHRVEFAFATRVFLDPGHVIVEDARKDYGESRHVIMGMIESRFYIVTYTMRDGGYRIISARKGNSRETKKYHQFYT